MINVIYERLQFLFIHEFELIVEEYEVREKAVQVRVKIEEDDLSKVTLINMG